MNMLELLNQKITIPSIQRDFAMGRNDNRSRDIREKFIRELLNAVYDAAEFALGELKKVTKLDRLQETKARLLFRQYLCDTLEDRIVYFDDVDSASFLQCVAKQWIAISTLIDVGSFGHDKHKRPVGFYVVDGTEQIDLETNRTGSKQRNHWQTRYDKPENRPDRKTDNDA